MNEKVQLLALTIEQLVEVLKRSGSKTVSAEIIRKDIANGAPVNPDGTISFVEYTAWLIKNK